MVESAWLTGPTKDVELSPPHGRGILCMDIQGNLVCTGSSDHGLRVYDMYPYPLSLVLLAHK